MQNHTLREQDKAENVTELIDVKDTGDMKLYSCGNRVVDSDINCPVTMLDPDRDNAKRNYVHYVNEVNYNLIKGAVE